MAHWGGHQTGEGEWQGHLAQDSPDWHRKDADRSARLNRSSDCAGGKNHASGEKHHNLTGVMRLYSHGERRSVTNITFRSSLIFDRSSVATACLSIKALPQMTQEKTRVQGPGPVESDV
jgi:hypothetical protein